MAKYKDLTGLKFNQLTVIRRVDHPTDKKNSYWACKCDCGNLSVVNASMLMTGRTKSCGCLRIKVCHRRSEKNISNPLATSITVNGKKVLTHLYRVYKSMINRCMNPKHDSYKYYGGHGITIDSSWNIFKEFAEWAWKNGYQENLSIDRIDPTKGYFPENCRWILLSENISRAHKGKQTSGDNPAARKCKCLNNGEIFDCLEDAAKKYCVDRRLIWLVCNKKRKQTKGLQFEYV